MSSSLKVNGYPVFFEKIGTGHNPILLIPGEIGTGRTDFQELLEGDDELDFETFTVIAVEAPGWGRSKPPIRKYSINVYDNDCECFHAVMQNLGYNKYSIIGYSDGARVALLMAAKYQVSVKSLTLTAMSTIYSGKNLSALSSTKTVEKWKKDKLEAFLKVYETIDELQKLWNNFLKFVEYFNQYFPVDFWKNKINLVKCPVLLFHGNKDPLIVIDDIILLSERLRTARLHRFPLGQHECHQKYSAQFVKLVQEHILNPSNLHDLHVNDINHDLMGVQGMGAVG